MKNPSLVAKHSFYPFIHKKMSSRKFRKCYDDAGKLKNDGLRESDKKTREIFYANHFDANIFSYYASLLAEKYETRLKESGLDKVATAYRSIPLKGKNRGMNNVDFAEEVFEFIRTREEYPVSVTTFDIKSFFDNLDHRYLKKAWANVLSKDTLPDDHYNVFKNITGFSYIEQIDAFNQCKDSIWVSDKDHNLTQKSIRNIRDLRRKNAVAFCQTSDFKAKMRDTNKIKSNKFEIKDGEKTKRIIGIPQGSPISSILANIYLYEFDELVSNHVNAVDGYYRRYSDDIVIVCPAEFRKELEAFVLESITAFKLTIQPTKTNSYVFNQKKDGKLECCKLFGERESNSKRLEYLGFEFDGQHTYIKSASISKFYRNMKNAFCRGSYYAVHSQYKEGKGRLFRKRLYRRFSYLGAKRKMKWERSPDDPQQWVRSTKHNWGNFLTYAYMAQYNMKDNKIRQQVSRHWNILNGLILAREKKIKES